MYNYYWRRAPTLSAVPVSSLRLRPSRRISVRRRALCVEGAVARGCGRGLWPGAVPPSPLAGHPIFDLWDPFGFTKKMSPEKKEKSLIAEINNGTRRPLAYLGVGAHRRAVMTPISYRRPRRDGWHHGIRRRRFRRGLGAGARGQDHPLRRRGELKADGALAIGELQASRATAFLIRQVMAPWSASDSAVPYVAKMLEFPHMDSWSSIFWFN